MEENREKDTGKVGKRPGICETVQMSQLTTGSEHVKGTGGYTEWSGGYTTEGCMRLGSRHTRRGEEFQRVENNRDRMNPALGNGGSQGARDYDHCRLGKIQVNSLRTVPMSLQVLYTVGTWSVRGLGQVIVRYTGGANNSSPIIKEQGVVRC
jgi:hypothetical protein